MVDVVQVGAGRFQKASERDVRPLRRECAQLGGLLGPPGRYRLPDALQHPLAGDAIEFHVAAGGEEREAGLGLLRKRRSAAAEQRPKPPVEAKLAAVSAYTGSPRPVPRMSYREARLLLSGVPGWLR